MLDTYCVIFLGNISAGGDLVNVILLLSLLRLEILGHILVSAQIDIYNIAQLFENYTHLRLFLFNTKTPFSSSSITNLCETMIVECTQKSSFNMQINGPLMFMSRQIDKKCTYVLVMILKLPH